MKFKVQHNYILDEYGGLVAFLLNQQEHGKTGVRHALYIKWLDEILFVIQQNGKQYFSDLPPEDREADSEQMPRINSGRINQEEFEKASDFFHLSRATYHEILFNELEEDRFAPIRHIMAFLDDGPEVLKAIDALITGFTSANGSYLRIRQDNIQRTVIWEETGIGFTYDGVNKLILSKDKDNDNEYSVELVDIWEWLDPDIADQYYSETNIHNELILSKRHGISSKSELLQAIIEVFTEKPDGIGNAVNVKYAKFDCTEIAGLINQFDQSLNINEEDVQETVAKFKVNFKSPLEELKEELKGSGEDKMVELIGALEGFIDDFNSKKEKDLELLEKFKAHFGEDHPVPPRHIMKSLVEMKEAGTYEENTEKAKPLTDAFPRLLEVIMDPNFNPENAPTDIDFTDPDWDTKLMKWDEEE